MKWKVLTGMFVLFFFMTSLVVLAHDDVGNVQSISDLKEWVAQLEADGEFNNEEAARALNVHLKAVEYFENQGETNKVTQHLNGFVQLLVHHHSHNGITERAYNVLKFQTEQLMEWLSSLKIVVDGQTKSVVVIAEDADEKTDEAAHTLVEYVQKSTGAELPIIGEEEWQEESFHDNVPIYIGMSASEQETYIEQSLENLHDEGFFIHPTGNQMTIIGPTAWGTLNGVYEFLERYVGVRWLLQGDLFEDVPTSKNIIVIQEDVREEPAFNYRRIKPFASSQQPFGKWLQRNRLQTNENNVIYRSHHLYQIFPPEKYGESNPEFYTDGIPPKPENNNSHTPNPCFTADGIVDAAVAEIIAYFDQNPGENSISLGVNDGEYCEAHPSHPEYPGKINSVGRVHMSDIYYEWVNEVVEQVLEVHPDKWFGALAYSNVTDPPSFPIHPRVVPFYTKDRNTWIDEDIRQESQQFIESWTQVADQVGLYDYPYGPYYDLPRVYPRLMAENYQYDQQHNIYGIEHEMYPTIIDGPKSWIAAKFMWDPNQDVDDLLDEWYIRTVGPAAADDLKAFYGIWEQFWTERIKGSEWFETGKGKTALPFRDPAYMDLVMEEDINESKRLIESVISKAETDQQKARAEMLLQAFEYVEASFLSHPNKIDPPQNAEAALSILDNVANKMDSRMLSAQKRIDLYEAFDGIPGLDMHISIGRAVPYRSGWNQHELWGLANYIRDHEINGGPVSNKVNELAGNNHSAELSDFARLLQTMVSSGDRKLFTLTNNASFEEAGASVPSWSTSWIRNSGSMTRAEGVSRTGDASLLIDDLGSGGPSQIVPVKPGLVTAQVYYYTPQGTHSEGSINLMVYAIGENGAKLRPVKSGRKHLADTEGEWESIEILEHIPEMIDGVKINRFQLVVEVNNARETQLYIDDAVIYQGMDELITPQTFWSIADEITENEPEEGPLRQRVTQIAANEEATEERDFARLLLKVVDGEATSITENSSFELGNGFAPPWGKWIPSDGSIDRVEGVSRLGNYSLRIKGLSRGGPIQDNIQVVPGPFALRVFTFVPPGNEEDTHIRLTLSLRGPNTSIFLPTQVMPKGDGWMPVDLAGIIPEEVDGVKVSHAQLIIGVYQTGDDNEVYVDDATIYQLQNE